MIPVRGVVSPPGVMPLVVDRIRTRRRNYTNASNGA
jgi:hypothetical protein